MSARITPAMVARSHTVGEPAMVARRRTAGLDRRVSTDGSTIVVGVADASSPPVVVTATRRSAAVGAGRGDHEVVVVAGNGRLVAIELDSAPVAGTQRELTRDGRAVAPAVSSRGEVACAIERDDAC